MTNESCYRLGTTEGNSMQTCATEPAYIIIVEDDAGHAAAIKRSIESKFPICKIDLVSNLKGFHNLRDKQTPDITLVDLNLKDGKSFELLTNPAENGDYPVLIITSHGSEESAASAIKLGALDYVVKTAESLNDMGYTVQRALKQWQLLKERQSSTEEIKQREKRFRALAENAPDIIARFDASGRYIYVNKSIRQKLGIPPDDCLGLTNTQTSLPHEIADIWHRTALSVLSMSKESTTTFRFERADKTLGYFHTLMVPELDEKGRVTTVLSITRDITNQRIVEETLRESESKYRTLVECADEAITVTEEEQIIFCNSAMSRLVGCELDHIITSRVIDLICPSDRQAFLDWQPKTNQNVAKSPSFRINRRDGGTRWVEFNSTHIPWGKSNTARLYFISDVTERKLIDEEKQRLVKIESIKIVSSGIAHDFNNILMAILGNMILLKQFIPPETEGESILSEAQNALIRAKGLTRQLLAFSKGVSSKRRNFALPGLIRESATLALRGSNISANYSFASNLASVDGDEEQLSQVITNLTINAKQAMPNGGYFTVSATNISSDNLPAKFKDKAISIPTYIKLIFSDTGVGIPLENLKCIFDPFFTTKPDGNGLGLASTVSIVEGHRGYIDVDSKIGKGTSFTIYLPASDCKVSEEFSPPDTSNRVLSNCRILVMDDEANIREITCKLLKLIGVPQSSSVPDGGSAIECYRDSLSSGNPFTAVILDMTVAGGMGGIETLRALKRINPEVKAILSSGYANGYSADYYQNEGFYGVIDKPFTLAQLKQTLVQVVNGEKGSAAATQGS
jgi:PAS domain S-box-containing protein